jgi:oligopeptide transport system substrate-binding protein
VAESVDISQDGRQYTFHLRESQWSNGLPVTAEDFAYAWTQILIPESDSFYGYAFYAIKNAERVKRGELPASALGVKALDAKTLQVDLEFTAPYFLELTSNPIYSPVCKAVVEEQPEWIKGDKESSFVSNGPFVLRSYQATDVLYAERNETYWDKDAVSLEQIQLTFVGDAMTAMGQFEAGELDFCGEPMDELPLAALAALTEQGGLQCFPMGGLYWYEFNTEREPFNSAKVRRALAYAIDRHSMVEHVLAGCADVATSIVPSCIGLSEGPHFPPYAPEEARELLSEGLSELGLSLDALPTITLRYGDKEGQKALAQVIQQQWQEVLGVTVQLQGSDWQVYLNDVFSGNFEVGGFYWYSWYMDPIYNLQAFKYADSAMNGPAWEDPIYRDLLDASDRTVDVAERWELLRQAEMRLIEEMPLTPAFEVSYHFVQNPALKGVVMSDLGQIDFKYAYFQ